MLKLVTVGCGEKTRMVQYTHMLQTELSCFIKQYSFRVYNFEKLWKAETSVELLKKNSKLSFPVNKDNSLKYWGAKSDVEYMDLHSRWFSSVSNENNILGKVMPYYSRADMESLLKEWIALPRNNPCNSPIYDLQIKYNYEEVEYKKDLCIIEWSLNEDQVYPPPMEVFKNIIVKLDDAFPDVFLSAYVKDETVELESDYFNHTHFNFELIESKFIDIGCMFYVCNHIKEVNNLQGTEDLQQYNSKELTNGTLYAFEGDNYYRINSTGSFLEKGKIPGFRVFNWSDLYSRKEFVISPNELISVYSDRYSPKNPTVVFSFGYTCAQLDCLPMLFDLECQERYNIKGILLHLQEDS